MPPAWKTIERLSRPELEGFWIHLDCDALDDANVPAVDYRLPDGLSWEEFETVLGTAIRSGNAVGMEITIFNPELDQQGDIARTLVDHITRAFLSIETQARPDGYATS